MIPTTLTANNTPTASSLNSGKAAAQNSMGTTSKDMIIGIASLVIEGRAFAEDDFHMLSLRQLAALQPQQPPRGGAIHMHNIEALHESSPHASASTSPASSLLLHGSDMGSAAFGGGRQSPKPSTSKAATGNSNTPATPNTLINITTNPHHAFGAATAPLYIETQTAYHSSSSAASSAESTHQRWTQKLCQLRQASGAANLSAPYEQNIAIEASSQSTSGEPELVSLAIHDPSTAAERGAVGGGDYEIVRRVMLSRSTAVTAGGSVSAMGASASSSPSSAGSENFLHSLQSLATTCLRGNSPAMDSPTGFALHYTTNAGSSSAHTKYAPYRATANTTTTTTPRFQSPYSNLELQQSQQSGSASSSGSGVQSPKLNTIASCHKRANPKVTSTMTSGASSTAFSQPCAAALTPKTMPSTAAAFNASPTTSGYWSPAVGPSTSSSSPSSTTPYSNSNSKPYPQQGPHCDQFLRKMGLAKGESAEAEDHYCDMSYVNITCSRWRAYCLKIEAIIERGEAICLEVFLGPANHKILLEQWIISYKEKVPPPTMTLPSLCSALRSQLYFSQISAWCDLIRKSDKSIYDTGRIVFGGVGGMLGCAAGDLATTTNASANLSSTPPNCSNNATTSTSGGGVSGGSSSGVGSAMSSATTASSSSSSSTLSRPRLNVFYRIRTHDATACFNSKPNIHNFPNVNISENCSISICLKSLPRINGGIPKIGASMMASIPNENFTPANVAPKFLIDETPRSSRQHVVAKIITPAAISAMAAAVVAATPAAPSTSISACYSNCDNQKEQAIDADDANGATGGSTADMKCLKNCSAATQVVTTEAAACLNDAAAPAPTTTNRQKCKFYIDESEQNSLLDDSQDIDFDDDLSEPHCSNGSCGSLSHREKQLLKYRKRMLKRDKKHTTHHNRPSFEGSESSQSSQQCHQPMEQGDDYYDDESEQSSSVQTVTLITARQRQRNTIEMISTGTQTAAVGCCEQCGGEKSLVCLKCAHGVDEMDACSVNSLSSVEIINTPRSKGDLLLQAIQRTPKAAKHKKQTTRSAAGYLNTTSSAPALNIRSSGHHAARGAALNNNHLASSSSSVVCGVNSAAFNSLSPCSSTSSLASLGSGCQVCKRQKTQHNFAGFNGEQARDVDDGGVGENGAANDGDTTDETDDRDGGKHHDECIEIHYSDTKMSTTNAEKEANKSTTKASGNDDMEEECFESTTILTFRYVHKASPIDVSATKQPQKQKTSSHMKILSEECFASSTKLTPNFEGFVLSGTRSNSSLVQQQATANQQPRPPPVPPKPMRPGQSECNTAASRVRSCTPTDPLAVNIDCEFKTPTSVAGNQQQSQQQQHTHKPTPKPTLLQVATTYGVPADLKTNCCSNIDCNNAQQFIAVPMLPQRKTLPKVNLTPIFCNGNNGSCHMQHQDAAAASASSSQSPDSAFPFDIVTINRVKFERAAAAAAAQMSTANNNNHQHYNNNNNNSHNINNNNTATMFDSNAATTTTTVPVQKSNSAPTLPNSPSLSPRFAKQAAIYKRRSRHLSDRSDRSSLGSDEQYSDEDLDCGSSLHLINGSSMAISPMKQRARFAAKFSRQPLLGNLEESLLHRRITPKMEVLGFKVLLGASGVFCPTQLTIPAAAYFYELHGETLSTPYLCEIGLPRKGYSVPRIGTIQVTLLNPLGTVVRMFVIPYDMHDMPPLHQTFIRQRVLAEMSAVSAATTTAASSDKQTNSLDMHSNGLPNGGDSNMQHSGQLDNNIVGDNCCKQKQNLGHFISAEHMKRLRYCIHLRFQTSRSGRLMLHTDIRLLISRRTDCDTAAAHAKGLLEAPNELIIDTVMPSNPKYSVRHDVNSRI